MAACLAYTPEPKEREKPPCLRLKHFLEEGDSLYSLDSYYCFDCKRIWSYTDSCFDKFPYWSLTELKQLDHPERWIGWMGHDAYPIAAFENGILSFELWVEKLTEAVDVRRPM